MNVFAVTLPMPPSVNSMFATDFKTKRRFTSKAYAAWKLEAGKIALEAWKAAGSPAFEPHLSLTIHLGLDYRSDIDGRVKAICDLLVKAIPGMPDDRWIDRLQVERVKGIEGARILLTQWVGDAR